MQSRRKPTWLKKLGEKRIDVLMSLAEKKAMEGEEELAKRYVFLARKIAEKVNIRIGKKYGKKFCRKCNTFFTSNTLKVRANKRNKTIEYICLRCGYRRRFPYWD